MANSLHTIVDLATLINSKMARKTNLATVESTTTASKAYAVGDYLIYGDVFYKVTTAIALGGTIVTTGAGVNVTADNIATELEDIAGDVDAITSVPTGGSTNQSLMKNSGTDGDLKWGDALGKKVSSTVSSATVAFTDASISATSIIDGPYIADVLMGIDDVEVSGTTITYTFDSSDANGKTAYIWIR